MNRSFRLLAAFSLFAVAAARGEPRHKAAHVLSSDRLQLEVMDPESGDRYYRGIRFSPVANVLRATLEGKEFFFSPVEHDPMTENAGLAMEFDINGPREFDEVPEGGEFLKIGVGVLRKHGEKYAFFKPYDLLVPARTDVEWGTDEAVFHQTCRSENGYAYVLRARVKVQGNGIRVQCRLANTGTKAFSTEQYAHNFFRLDPQAPIGPGYVIEFPYDFETKIPKPVFEQRGRVLALTGEVTVKMKGAVAFVTSLDPGRKSDSALVRHEASGLQIRASVSLPTDRITIFANSLFISPEQFVRLSLKPGESVEWERSYTLEIVGGKTAPLP